MARGLATFGLSLLIIAGAAMAYAYFQVRDLTKVPGPLAEAICVQVRPGASMQSVSRDLEAQGAIRSGMVFRLTADYSEKSHLLKAGSFLVPPGASVEEIIEVVTVGGRSTCGTEVNFRIGVLRASVVVRELDPASQRYQELVSFTPGEDAAPQAYLDVLEAPDVRLRVTVAEGATSWQIVESLKSADFLTGEVAEVPAEGALAPDSYEVRRGSERAVLITRMQEAQVRRLGDLWAARVDGLPLASPEEALILASIIEKETGVPEERRQVASVFINRLNRGMRLQTDPTVIYGITNGEGALGRGLRQSELRRATPYNTYVIDGLPPTPIANPGLESLRAALDPDTTPFVFFVADGTGGHAFAETLAEHNANVARWRQIEAERANQ